MKKTNNHWEISVLFRRGKVVGKIGPYTVNTQADLNWGSKLHAHLTATSTPHLFHFPTIANRNDFMTQVRTTLRRQNTALDVRSLRRGAAQKMAAERVPYREIMKFTKHKDEQMLKRYLRFGMALSEEGTRATAAASALMQ
jgi:hypothetical protein